ERVLEHFLGRLPIARQAIGRPIDRRAVAGEELLEGVQVVSLDTAQQLRIQSLIRPRRGASRSVVRREVSVQATWPKGRLLNTRYAGFRRKVHTKVSAILAGAAREARGGRPPHGPVAPRNAPTPGRI